MTPRFVFNIGQKSFIFKCCEIVSLHIFKKSLGIYVSWSKEEHTYNLDLKPVLNLYYKLY